MGTQIEYFDITVNKHLLSIEVAVPDYEYIAGAYMPSITTSDVHGRVRFADGQTLKEGTHSYEWIFEPYDEHYYEAVTGTVEITALAAPFVPVEVPSPAPSTASGGGKASTALAIVFGCVSAALAVALVLASVLKRRKNTVNKD